MTCIISSSYLLLSLIIVRKQLSCLLLVMYNNFLKIYLINIKSMQFSMSLL